jgi:hypothetical protein
MDSIPMKSEFADKLAEQTGQDADELLERWNGAPEKFAEDVFRVRNLETNQIEDLSLFYPYQPRLMHAYFYSDAKIINVYKGRRIGVSFIFGLCTLMDAMFTPGTFFPVVSKTKSQAESRLSDIYTLIENAKVDIPLETDNKGEIELWNGSRIMAYTGEPDGSRGDDSAKSVFVDEMAFLDDQEATMRAFMPFISLGDAQMLQVSTPKVSNDIFLGNHEDGDELGSSGILTVKQPTFANADEIDPETSLFEQETVPVRPDLNVGTVETERAQDPQGFAQEYLCQPVSDEYRFFSMDTIHAAQSRGSAESYAYGPNVTAQNGGTMIMGVDIGLDSDDTAISVFEHIAGSRNLRFHTILERSDLRALGVFPEEPANPSSVAEYIYKLGQNMNVKYCVLDKTGPGEGFQREVERRFGRGAHGFNFSDQESVKEMMGDFNYGLHNDKISLHPDEAIKDQLAAVVKKQDEDYQHPKFSGKDHAPNGKDDLAMSLVLGAYPPMLDAERSHEAHSKQDAWAPEKAEEQPKDVEGYRGVKQSSPSSKDYGVESDNEDNLRVHGTRGRKSGYSGRNRRT